MTCQNGDLLAQEQETAASKEKVLDAMGAAASKLRARLGESLATVKAFDVPLEQASTPSLEALKAYSLGRKMESAKGATAALPFYQRAVELDPNFAMAYQELAGTYSSLGQFERGAQNARKAYDLRAKVSDREDIDCTIAVRDRQDSGGKLNSQESRLGQVAANLYGQSVTKTIQRTDYFRLCRRSTRSFHGLDSHEELPGPIYLQSSEKGHVLFRCIVITPEAK